ncbi:hypothetical protein NKH18_28300 [Streptomyces sp. M10(2022)]
MRHNIADHSFGSRAVSTYAGLPERVRELPPGAEGPPASRTTCCSPRPGPIDPARTPLQQSGRPLVGHIARRPFHSHPPRRTRPVRSYT